MKFIDGFRNSETATAISRRIADLSDKIGRRVTIMEVCGTHTMSIAKFAIRNLLPQNIRLVSGPGCPVCVTPQGYIDAAISLAEEGKHIVTFADMMNVPGTSSSLTKARSEGANVQTCYSPEFAIEAAEMNQDAEVVFLGVGFETTIGPVTNIVSVAYARKIPNLSMLTAFKLIPPAMHALAADSELKIDAFLCPAHVSAIIGAEAYRPFATEYHRPCVIAGFEPLDILSGIEKILLQISAGEAKVENNYARVVRTEGNRKALSFIGEFLEPADSEWRGLGKIPMSGMSLKREFSSYDAGKRYCKTTSTPGERKGCRCGDVLKGKITPDECPLFSVKCTPSTPVGPCMVSSEGTCAAYYKYPNSPR